MPRVSCTNRDWYLDTAFAGKHVMGKTPIFGKQRPVTQQRTQKPYTKHINMSFIFVVLITSCPYHNVFHFKKGPYHYQMPTQGFVRCLHAVGEFEGTLGGIIEYQDTRAIIKMRLRDTPADILISAPYSALVMSTWEKVEYQLHRWRGRLKKDNSYLRLADTTIFPSLSYPQVKLSPIPPIILPQPPSPTHLYKHHGH